MKTVLTIAGSDSSGGAGIQADLQAIAAQGLHGATAITAITAQCPRRVRQVAPVTGAQLHDQLQAVAGMPLAAIKTGMLATAELVAIVGDFLRENRTLPIVVDPVLVSSSGHPLLDQEGRALFLERIVPMASVLTPNIPEAHALLGRSLTDPCRAHEVIVELGRLGSAAVVLKGGHQEGERVQDLLWDGVDVHTFERPRVAGGAVHGTGCVHASTLASLLALEVPLMEAASRTQAHLHHGITQARVVGAARLVEPAPGAVRALLR